MSFVSLDRNVLFATAIVSAIVNGYNSASFKYSSEHYIDRLDGRETKHPFRRYFGPAVCQFISDLIISVVSLIPLFLMGNMPNAIVYSYLITLAILFVVGYYRAYLLNMPRWRMRSKSPHSSRHHPRRIYEWLDRPRRARCVI